MVCRSRLGDKICGWGLNVGVAFHIKRRNDMRGTDEVKYSSYYVVVCSLYLSISLSPTLWVLSVKCTIYDRGDANLVRALLGKRMGCSGSPSKRRLKYVLVSLAGNRQSNSGRCTRVHTLQRGKPQLTRPQPEPEQQH